MSRVKAAHHRGTHQVQARKITRQAQANPNTTCWRCARTLNEHPPHHNGRPAYWTAGHIIDGIGPYAPEASVCNYSAGATAGNLKRNTDPHSEQW